MPVSTNSVKMNNMVTSNEAKEGNHMEEKKVVFDTRELNLWYGEDQALKNINLEITSERSHSYYWSIWLWKINVY